MPDYEEDAVKCKEFLQNFTSEYDETSANKYTDMLQEVADRKRRSLLIDLADISSYFQNEELTDKIKSNTRRYRSILAEAADSLLPPPITQAEDDVFDVLTRQRMQAQEGEEVDMSDEATRLPSALTRRFDVHFGLRAKDPVCKLREVGANHIGHTIAVKGIVTRVGDVRPYLEVATYTCDDCGFEIYQEVTSSTFTPLEQCPGQVCKTNKKGGRLYLQTRGSRFQKYQEIKIQELAEEVPMGCIPRTLTVQVKGDLVRTVAPGDVIDVTGVFLPVPRTGFRAMRAGLVAEIFLEAMGINQHKKKYSEHVLTPEIRERVEAFSEEVDIYSKLARSLAPEIYGHEDCKKALLLQLVGGGGRHMPDGMKLRGDVHLCLMGDPGVAKSQLLKYVCKLAPRAVYTTGKGSSGVGLTAAVQRDPVTSDTVLEGGALVLADMGICCIDEFDKMEESDRTAIHEVMEQQTVSIAKAGITTTLNARTAVLAAANPAWGRYDLRRTPEENIALPAALLSRFDLLWLILDKADEEADLALAQHILHVHRYQTAPDLDFEVIAASEMRAYIAEARRYSPFIPQHLSGYIEAAYAELRQEEKDSDCPHTYTTARTLLSILRLSEALARLRFSEEVMQADVDEALRLMKMSKISLANEEQKTYQDPVTQVFGILRDEAHRQNSSKVDYAKAMRLIAAKGIREDMLEACLQEYASLNVWQLDADNNITFVDA
ncbi:Mcm2-7 hexameric complex component [Cymbomonas tetramitiformis]|uniref:DNA replication licensing factor MCM7 n=1 Tax=Cymbomonas tetramitiformis TaxID=36881 RepID=A0AAE0BBZ6_9CHLO|nr:Mcm2-7 hexameric complex component [Cymbomonas tetramitiformis]